MKLLVLGCHSSTMLPVVVPNSMFTQCICAITHRSDTGVAQPHMLHATACAQHLKQLRRSWLRMNIIGTGEHGHCNKQFTGPHTARLTCEGFGALFLTRWPAELGVPRDEYAVTCTPFEAQNSISSWLRKYGCTSTWFTAGTILAYDRTSFNFLMLILLTPMFLAKPCTVAVQTRYAVSGCCSQAGNACMIAT